MIATRLLHATRILAAMAAIGMAAPAAGAEPPRRVVSINVCTDQLAILLAGKDQLYSVSHLSRDPSTSKLADRARNYAINHGVAEEVALMQPDLVLAGTYSSRVTVDLLRRLGFRVEEFAPAASIEDIRQSIGRIGGLLGREAQAAALISGMDEELARLRQAAPARQQNVAIYESNSYAAGTGTLGDAVIAAAGLANVSARLGLTYTARLPLEQLLLADPDLIVTSERQDRAPALATEIFRHPALRHLGTEQRMISIPSKYWICGTPQTLEAARLIQEAARRGVAGQ